MASASTRSVTVPSNMRTPREKADMWYSKTVRYRPETPPALVKWDTCMSDSYLHLWMKLQLYPELGWKLSLAIETAFFWERDREGERERQRERASWNLHPKWALKAMPTPQSVLLAFAAISPTHLVPWLQVQGYILSLRHCGHYEVMHLRSGHQ